MARAICKVVLYHTLKLHSTAKWQISSVPSDYSWGTFIPQQQKTFLRRKICWIVKNVLYFIDLIKRNSLCKIVFLIPSEKGKWFEKCLCFHIKKGIYWVKSLLASKIPQKSVFIERSPCLPLKRVQISMNKVIDTDWKVVLFLAPRTQVCL